MEDIDEEDCHEWKGMIVNLQERNAWRLGGRSAIHAASQLSGGSTILAHACLTKTG